MFTASHFKLIRKECPDELAELLSSLNIPLPDFDNGDEYDIYADLDQKIENDLKRQMKNDSILGGYMTLLNKGKISFSRKEILWQLLEKIVINNDKVLQGLTKPASNVSSGVTSQHVKPYRGRSPLTIGGGALVVASLAYAIFASKPNMVLCGIGLLLGGLGVVKGERSRATITSPAIRTQTIDNVVMSEFQAEKLLADLKQVYEIYRKIS